MPDKRVLPYGSWPTPITSAVLVANAVGLADVAVDGQDVIWAEERPDEGGRTALVKRSEDGRLHELLAPDDNARTAVHEYGGGAWWADAGVVWFANWVDQRLYRRDPGTGRSVALTPAPKVPRGDRYADGALSPDRQTVVCVREHHPPDGRGPIDVRNEIVRLASNEPSTPEVLVTGPDFVSTPRLDPDGSELCWVEWDHPNMPWDGTRLLVRDLASGEQRLIAGGDRESVIQPQWQDDGSLTFISDRSGWWNLYRFDGAVEPLVEIEAEIGEPQWEFGQSRYARLGDGRVLFARTANGSDGLTIRLGDGGLVDLELPFTRVHNLSRYGDSSVVLIGATPTAESAVVRVSFGRGAALERVEALRPPRDLGELGVDADNISLPEVIDYPSADGRVAHAVLYRPRNRDYRGGDDELPPLLVHVHGGPTADVSPQLRLELQYLTSRGFAVIDVNYGGSSGYGRAYRELLNENWGVVDVEDSIAAALYLVERGDVDPRRLCVSGGSAGGYTTLACMARSDTPFGAGGDYFGVADLEAMTLETHKFDRRYLDRLVGANPQARATYRARSPIDHVDQLSRPLIVLQGLEDEVVPPNQATMIVDALRSNGVPVAYIAFEGEQHGFRLAANIRRAIDSELSFYAQVFGFELPPDEGIEPVAIERP